MASLQGKVFTVTGAASGMGKSTAKLLASRGATVSLTDIQDELLNTVAEEIKKENNGAKVLTMKTDIRDRNQVDAWIKTTVDELGPIDGCANIAGIFGRNNLYVPIEKQDEDDWKFIIDVNLTGTMHCLRAQLGAMNSAGGSIVNCSSVLGVIGGATNGAYTASKHGIIGLTRSAAKEVGSRNIRVNVISPGYVHTPMQQDAAKVFTPEQQKANNPAALGRIGTCEEVANLVVFLLGDESTFISGAVHMIDGAWVC
ncbi:MAG: hypothetical protein M1834_007871 [Cirrosporium novae-zelandiae]|nr:MAG: hypothetical protein M1834_007871 [Cirrosporium novae-zelandiae]